MNYSILLALLALFLSARSLPAAMFDAFLEIDGIKGESRDDKHAQAIQIHSFRWNSTNSPSGSGGLSGGKVSFSDLSCVATLSKASPQLLMASATSNVIARATLYLRDPATREEFARYELQNVLVTSYQTSGHAASDAVPTDQFSLNFTKVTWVYTSANGEVNTAVVSRPDPQ
jgi:type VI secretion system secreted protein Hcp